MLNHRVALGGAGYSLYEERDDQAAIATIAAAYDAGIRVFDTARAYATVTDSQHNESLFARALVGREGTTVMTKGGHFRTGPRDWAVDNSPSRLRQDVDDSRRALGVECLDLFFVHRVDGGIDLPEVMGALDELRREGHIAHIGLSNVTVAELAQAQTMAPVAAVQNRYTIGVDSELMVHRFASSGVAFFAYSPFGGPGAVGTLVKRFPRLSDVAHQHGISLQRLLLRGILATSPCASVVVGAGQPLTAIDAAAAEVEQWTDEAALALGADRDSLDATTG